MASAGPAEEFVALLRAAPIQMDALARFLEARALGAALAMRSSRLIVITALR